MGYGWWQSGRLYALSDPDHITLTRSFGGNKNTTGAEARARYTAAVISGTVMMLSDDYGPSSDAGVHREALARARALATNAEVNAVARLQESFVPLETAGDSAARVYALERDGKVYVAVFNFDDAERTQRVEVAGAKARNLWTGEELDCAEGAMSVTLGAGDAGLFVVEWRGLLPPLTRSPSLKREARLGRPRPQPLTPS